MFFLDRTRWLFLERGVEQFAAGFHFPQARVVELIFAEVGQDNHSGQQRVVVGDIGATGAAMFKLYGERVLELPQMS